MFSWFLNCLGNFPCFYIIKWSSYFFLSWKKFFFLFYASGVYFCLQYVNIILLSPIWIANCPHIFQWIACSFLTELWHNCHLISVLCTLFCFYIPHCILLLYLSDTVPISISINHSSCIDFHPYRKTGSLPFYFS